MLNSMQLNPLGKFWNSEFNSSQTGPPFHTHMGAQMHSNRMEPCHID